MQALRTIVWVAVSIILVAFVAINWTPVRVNFWPLEQGYIFFDWPIGFVAIAFFLLGLLPMWLVHRTARWRFQRRIGTLENSVRAASVSTYVPAAAAGDALSPDPAPPPA
jgi:putative membrane protein